jgi:RNA polymerase sigma-70 factor (ECF subfamily)
MDQDHEAELLALARLGNQPALSELFEPHHARLVRMVKLRLDARLQRRLDPADVVQEAWVEVVQRFSDWSARDAVPFRVWLRLTTRQTLARVERRHLGTEMRAQKREEREHLARTNVTATSMADALVASTTSPIQGAQREELRSRVLAALEELDETDREIVTLRHFEGLSNEDAAAELSIESAAASKRFTRALLRLRPLLDSLASRGEGTNG